MFDRDTEPLYFEDLTEGETFDCGSIDVEREEMLEFARRYDPQPIHTDPDAAAESMFGGLIASGWFTCALSTRLLVTGYMNKTATLGGRGMDDVRWHRPVRAGDTLSVTVELAEKRAGDSPEFGHTRAAVTATNGDGEVVLTMEGLGLVEKR
jgi:acyl dehydratase